MRIIEASANAPPSTLVFVKKPIPAGLRRDRGLTQFALSRMVGMHISQIRRYESGQSQPTLDAIRKLAVALSVSADMLLFEKSERGPDEELKLQFEAVSRLDAEEKKVIRSVIESIILRNTMKEAEGRFAASGAAVSHAGAAL